MKTSQPKAAETYLALAVAGAAAHLVITGEPHGLIAGGGFALALWWERFVSADRQDQSNSGVDKWKWR
jgi:hypothetical protein